MKKEIVILGLSTFFQMRTEGREIRVCVYLIMCVCVCVYAQMLVYCVFRPLAIPLPWVLKFYLQSTSSGYEVV